MRHHTKDKGDCGVGFVIADLISKGIQVAFPLSEHLPFDLIAISELGKLARISVKYRSLADGSIRLVMKSSYADKKGNHVRKHAKDDYDAFAVYCPETKKCYYISIKDITGHHFALRVRKSHQYKRINHAALFTNPNRIFK